MNGCKDNIPGVWDISQAWVLVECKLCSGGNWNRNLLVERV